MLRCALTLALFAVAGPSIAWTEDLGSSYQALQDALAKKDAALIKKLAAETSALARRSAAEPAPSGTDEQDAWKKQVAYAKEVEGYTEYALYAAAIQGEPAVTVDLFGA